MAIERDKAGFQLKFSRHRRSRQPHHLDVFEAVAKPMASAIAATASNTHKFVASDDLPRFAKLNVHRFHAALHQPPTCAGLNRALAPIASKALTLGPPGKKWRAPGLRHRLSRRGRQPLPRTLRLRHAPAFPTARTAAGWQPQEKISLQDCISAYTSGSAYAEFEEGKKGELKTGEYADFIVLSNDLTKVPPSAYVQNRSPGAR